MGNSSVQLGVNSGVEFNASWLEFASSTAPFEPKPNTGISRQELEFIVSLLDLTSLNSEEDSSDVLRLFEDSVRPLAGSKQTAAGACVFPTFLALAGTWVSTAGVRLVAVAGGFPHALSSQASRVAEIRLLSGLADEVDFPIPRHLAREGRWRELYDDIQQMVMAARGTPVKVILGTGDLLGADQIYGAAMAAMMAGAQFIKTSTGKERINARLDAGAIMCQAIRDFRQRSGFEVGIKPAGGIKTPADAMVWVELVRARLGDEWIRPTRLRIGASGLLAEIRRTWSGEDRPIAPVTY
jgi:deoxyribose-phosphate aldolase